MRSVSQVCLKLRPLPWLSPICRSPLRRVLNPPARAPYSKIKHPAPRTKRPKAASKSPETASPPDAVTKVKLRQYQEECIQSVLAYLEKGHKRLGISLATGSGKTVIFTQLIDRIAPPTEDATQTIILVHRRELAEQAAKHCRNAYPTKTVEIEMGDMHASGHADITIASVRSIISAERMQKFDPQCFKLVLVDEAHHIVAKGYMDTLEHFGLLDPTKQSPALVGVSATLSRFDGLRLGAAIDHIVYHKDYVDMIGEKWLSDVIFTTVESKADLSKVRKAMFKDFLPSMLSKAVNTTETNEITVRAWLARAKERKSTIVFCVDIAHVLGLTTTFMRHGIDARSITGETPQKVRRERLDSFRNGEYPVLVNCGVFTEGTDIPNIDCVLLARPTRSRNLLVQMIGRGMRLHPEKTNCHVIDMVASLQTGIVTVPTLFGLDPSELVKEASVDDLKLIREIKQTAAARELTINEESAAKSTSESPHEIDPRRTVLFTDYDSVFDLIDDTSGERHIRVFSQLAWVEVGPDRYILSGSEGEYLLLEKAQGSALYRVIHNAKVPITALMGMKAKGDWRPYQRGREIATAGTFLDAVHGADTFANETFPRYMAGKDQAWRKAPATPGQLTFLNKLRPRQTPLTEDQISKGRAADMITKVKFGAKGRLDRMRASKRRIEKGSETLVQAARMRQREEVRVGPLGA